MKSVRSIISLQQSTSELELPELLGALTTLSKIASRIVIDRVYTCGGGGG